MSNILEVKDLSVSYGGIKAVKNISFQVPKGEIVTLIGANGAGKSSTLRSIVGLVKPKTGSIKLNGNEIAGKTPEQIVSQGRTSRFCRSYSAGEFKDRCIYAQGQPGRGHQLVL